MLLGSIALICTVIVVYRAMLSTCTHHKPTPITRPKHLSHRWELHPKDNHQSLVFHEANFHCSHDTYSLRKPQTKSLHKARYECFTKHVKRKKQSNHRKKARLKEYGWKSDTGGKVRRKKHLSSSNTVNNVVQKPNNISYSIILDDHINSKEYIKWDNGSFTMTTNHLEESFLSQGEDAVDTVWPVKNVAVVEGDVVVGGLMMVHSRSEKIKCGPVMAQGGIQALETMLYTLDVINSKKDKKITIGAHILDDCDTDTYGLEMALDFIKGSISNIDDTDYHCNKTQVRKVISGVVGAASSVTSIQVANLLRLFKIPQVSFFSTSPELSNKQRFEYFTRTIPSDHYQVKAMVEIVKKLKWSYVSIIYEESNYGIKAFEELEVLLGKSNICIAVKEKLVKDSGVAEEIAYDDIVLKLMTKPRARGVIVFGSDQEVAGVMRAVKRLNATGSFSWVGSDGWSARGLVSDGSEAEVEGTLSLQPQANPVRGFDEYFLNLTVENNRRNPWFVEFWEDHFRCKYPNSSRTPYNAHYTKECTTREKLTRESLAFEKQLQFVSDAVMAFSIALNHMHAELCHGKIGLCESMRPTKGPELLKYLRKVSFQGLSGDHFKFDKDGDGPARYNIIHFKQTSPGVYQWVQVGEYLEGELRLNTSAIQFKITHPSPPESVCSLPCDIGQAKKYVEGESCCWHCFNCSQYQIRMPYDETQCMTCPEGTKPDHLRVRCLEIPSMFIQITSTWAIGAMALSSTGILMTLLIVGVFVRHNNTPVVKAAGRELSYVLLFGILLCYLVTFVLVLKPSDVVCAIQRFGAGFCFTVVYAALLTKTNRISRIFNAGKRTAKRPSFITPKSQLIICGGLVSVQVLINGVWMLVSPPRAIHHYPSREDNILVCSSFINASYMIAFGYPILLIVVCTVYAILTRNIPEAFNESKHIGFTMYTTCVIWLAFVPLYFGTGNHMPLRITTMSVTISLSASVTVACLFSPKLYIILLRPDRNVRTSMMMTYRYSGGTAKTTTSVSMMAAAMAVTGGTNAQISQQLNNAVNQKVLELELNTLKNNNCAKSPLLITRSTQTLDEDQNETTPTSEDPAVYTPNSSNHEGIALPNNSETASLGNPSNTEAPSIPNSFNHQVPSFHNTSNNEVPSNCPSTPTSNQLDSIPHPHSPSYPSAAVFKTSPTLSTLPSPHNHHNLAIHSPSNHRSSTPFTQATPSLPSSTANGGTRLTNESTTSL
uniref:Metabotropic glutamate receptor n=1 Tax=Cacopsylla melanoneura TaxID=428564 RepID=A0A8D9BA63_9HEMI